ncbi:DUF4303 domain-containing protein [Microbulbifer aggregans]|uniref:DUF4303 domain-containing protein n=1 Tax=Microbulbifer aggregans TaxID=1769779 RepID=UPI001CFE0D28|nr:DUF4303 domain-containing protein [Microbulbifer aggregans]
MSDMAHSEIADSFQQLLVKLDNVFQQELTRNIDLIYEKYIESGLYGIILDSSGNEIALRFQTRAKLDQISNEMSGKCGANSDQLKNFMLWRLESFGTDSEISFSQTTAIAKCIYERQESLFDDALEKDGKEFHSIYALSNDLDLKIKEVYVKNLSDQHQVLYPRLENNPIKPIGISYCSGNGDKNRILECMAEISGDSLSQISIELGDGSVFSSLDCKTQENINTLLGALASSVKQEASSAFKKILTEYGGESIYSLYLYHNGDCTSYLFPGFNSENGLNHVAKLYSRHSQISFDENRMLLRWSPCDSPYHGDHESDLKKTEQILSELSKAADEASDHALKYLNIEPYSDCAYELSREISKKIHDMLVEQLREISRLPDIAEYIQKTDCVVWITAGDTSDDPVEDIARIHDESVACKVKQEMVEGERLSEIDYELQTQNAMKEAGNPSVPSFDISDFDPVVDEFNPEFVEHNGGIYLKGVDENAFLDASSRSEASHNIFDLMRLLKKSPFYDEIEKLYGHFIGAEFKKDDFLPEIGRKFSFKLRQLLSEVYPDRSFTIYMEVSRGSQSRIQFFQNRQDGYTPAFKSNLVKEGVRESWLIGSKPPSVRFPVGFFVDDGKAVAQVFGMVANTIRTNRSLSEHSVVCEGIDYDQASHIAREALLEHLNSSFHESHLEFDCVHYPEVAVGGHEQGLVVFDMSEFHGHVQYWRMIEVTPNYLTKNLVSQ